MAQVKFGRNYSLVVGLQNGSSITLAPPFTLELDITRNMLTSANVCQLRIYNLSQNNRNQIRYDFSNYGELRPVQLRAGYGNNLPVVFSGNISQAWSYREGTNFITQIECFDGGFAFQNGISNQQFPAGTTQETILTTLMGDLPGVSFGAISSSYIKDPSGTLYTTARGTSYTGNTAELLGTLSGNGFFIDNSKSYILANNAAFEGGITVIDASTGLLDTPIREQTIVNINTLFEPRLSVGQKIQLSSLTSDFNVNGTYKVISVKHRGIISETVSGNLTTSAGFFYGTQALEIVGVN